jgi:hypothetical protein
MTARERREPTAGELRAAFQVLARAVRAHELITAHHAVPRRPGDHALYRRLSELDRPARLVLTRQRHRAVNGGEPTTEELQAA